MEIEDIFNLKTEVKGQIDCCEIQINLLACKMKKQEDDVKDLEESISTLTETIKGVESQISKTTDSLSINEQEIDKIMK